MLLLLDEEPELELVEEEFAPLEDDALLFPLPWTVPRSESISWRRECGMGASSRADRAADVAGPVVPPVACCTFPKTLFRVMPTGRLPAAAEAGSDEEFPEPPQPSSEPAVDPTCPEASPSTVCGTAAARPGPVRPPPP